MDMASPDALRDACLGAAGGPIDVIVDLLWGTSAVAALQAAAPGGRLVQVGSLAARTAAVPAIEMRAKQLSISGLSCFLTPVEVRAPAYTRLVQHASAGQLIVDVECLPLEQVAEAWERQGRAAHCKLVITPTGGF